MTFLALQPLTVALLPAALELDQRCFGGLWTLDGYQRELESPNSELLVLVEESRVRRQEPGDAKGAGDAQETGRQEKFKSKLKTPSGSIQEEQSASLASLASPASPSHLLGLGCYWAILEETHITMLAIDPTYHRQGLGQALLYALLVSAYKRGLERATLEVRVSNHAALSLYQRFDFREAGRRRRYYPDDGEDALVLWRGGIQTPEFSERLQVWQQQVCDRLCTAGWQLTIA